MSLSTGEQNKLKAVGAVNKRYGRLGKEHKHIPPQKKKIKKIYNVWKRPIKKDNIFYAYNLEWTCNMNTFR